MRLAAKAAPWISATLLALPRICLAAGDPLHPLGPTTEVTLEGIIGRMISALLGLLGSISLVMFVYGGLTWMMAAGNEERIKKAKNTLVYATLGLIIAFGSYTLLQVFMGDVLGTALGI